MSSTQLAAAVASVLLLIGSAHGAEISPSTRASDEHLYVGTYTGPKSQGIYLFGAADTKSGGDERTLEPLGLAAEVRNPSFLEIDPRRRLLFAVNEVQDLSGARGGAVSSYAIDRSGALKLINQQSTKGAGPCHLALDKTGKFVLAANYGGGSVVVLPVAEDGKLGPASDFVQHAGSSVNTQRQAGPHAHYVTLDPSNRFALVCDLGLDQVLVYRFDAEQGTLSPNDPPSAALKPGAGPRHLAFHPGGKLVYVINELDSTITGFTFDGGRGALTQLETVSTLPADFAGENTTAEIAVHPSGKFLFGSNRGHDSIVSLAIDQSSGTLSGARWQQTGGETPRHFEVDPRGEYLIAANQNTDALVMFQIDQQSGGLQPVGKPIACPTPVCIKFLSP